MQLWAASRREPGITQHNFFFCGSTPGLDPDEKIHPSITEISLVPSNYRPLYLSYLVDFVSVTVVETVSWEQCVGVWAHRRRRQCWQGWNGLLDSPGIFKFRTAVKFTICNCWLKLTMIKKGQIYINIRFPLLLDWNGNRREEMYVIWKL